MDRDKGNIEIYLAVKELPKIFTLPDPDPEFPDYLILNARKKNIKSLKIVVKIIIQFIMKTSKMLWKSILSPIHNL